MKTRTKINFLMGLALAMASSCTQKPANEFVITGNIKGINNGMLKLARNVDSNRTTVVLDSVALKNGTFELRGVVDNPELMTLTISPGNWGMRLFVENSKITIEGDTTGAEHYDYTAYGMDKGAILNQYKVSGSKSQDEYQQYENDPEQLKFKQAFAALNKTKGIDHEVLRARADSISKLYKAWQWNYIGNFVAKNPSSAAGVLMFNQYYEMESAMPLADMEGMLAKFKGPAKASVYFKALQKEVTERKAILPGNLAEDFTLLKPDSNKFTLSSLRGKYVMIDFWASWCKPCREAIPHWKEVYAKYKDKGFEIVGVTNDNKWDLWKKALAEEKMPWIQVADDFPVKNMPARIASRFKSPTIPQYVLLDKEGRILVVTNHKEDIDRKLNELF